jgi:hypothetical protein
MTLLAVGVDGRNLKVVAVAIEDEVRAVAASPWRSARGTS